MQLPGVHYLAVLVSGVVIFMLGGLWYSPVLFAKPWVALQGKTMEEMRQAGASPVMYGLVFLCGLVVAWAMAVVLAHFPPWTAMRGAEVGALMWFGFAAPTSYGTALFSMKPKALWAIDTAFNLVSFVIAGIVLSVWR
ncbi:MAG: DUF1761 domain-containing protein [Gemmatimonadaceae bacterium]